MLVAEWRGSRLVVAIVGALAGCDGSHDEHDAGAVIDAAGPDAALDSGLPCSAPVATGEYTLAILPLLDGPTYGPRFELAADGTFAGHLWASFPDAPARCDGMLTPEERNGLSDAINAGQFFCRGNTFVDTFHDIPYSDFELRTIDGLRANRFCGHDVPVDPALSALTGAVEAALMRVWDSGGCMGQPYEVPMRTEQCSLWPLPPPMPPPP